jgi:hypothetical protein
MTAALAGCKRAAGLGFGPALNMFSNRLVVPLRITTYTRMYGGVRSLGQISRRQPYYYGMAFSLPAKASARTGRA